MNKDEMKNRISLALKDPILQQGFEIICKNLAELEKENTELKEELERNCTPEEICMKLEERIHTLEVYLEGAINFLILNGDVDNPIIKSVENILHITFNKNIIY